MKGIAVILAGVTGRILPSVLNKLRARFSERYVFRGDGGKINSMNAAYYTDAKANRLVDLACDAVFGQDKRPLSFCSHEERSCSLSHHSKKRCRLDDNGTCGLMKPGSLILFMQEGINEEVVLRKLHYSAFVISIPKDCYDREDKTFSCIIHNISYSLPKINELRSEMASSRTPFLLPPLNFRDEKLSSLLGSAGTLGLDRSKMKDFKARSFNRPERSFQGRNQLLFSPAHERHGEAGPQEDPAIALSRYFRLGVAYDAGFHYDVRRPSQKSFDGSIEFQCRVSGNAHPSGTHVNVLVDDCLRGRKRNAAPAVR